MNPGFGPKRVAEIVVVLAAAVAIGAGTVHLHERASSIVQAAPPAPSAAPAPRVLATLPEFVLEDERGRPFDVADLRGTVWVADFRLSGLWLRDFAAPELPSEFRFRADHAGRYDLRGDELCGLPHTDKNRGWLIVEDPASFRAWVQKRARGDRPQGNRQ